MFYWYFAILCIPLSIPNHRPKPLLSEPLVSLGQFPARNNTELNHRWRNAAQWARQSMIYDGYLKSDSPRGVWEVSDKGREFLNTKINR